MPKIMTDHLDIWTTAQKQKKAVGRGKAKKDTVYGIKKLRELILELAVRGKLVPQDANDEPASVLLERIAEEKQRLIKERKIKKQKALPEIEENKKPFELPNGWEWTHLDNLSENIHYGYTASANQSIKNVRLLRITDIQNNFVDWESVPGCEIQEKNISNYQLKNGDILIARTGGTIGKSYLVDNITLCSVFASYLIRVKNLKETSSKFIKIYLGSQLYWQQLLANSMGTGQPNVNGNALKNLIFTLPPLAEQHRIVAKVDELMALCDQLEQEQIDHQATHQILVETLLNSLVNAAKTADNCQTKDKKNTQYSCADYFNQFIVEHFDTLFTTEKSIEQLKHTILQLAVMGKLVPQDPNDEPASVLLEKIAKEKTKLLKEGKIKKQKVLPEIGEDEKPFELPNGWEWVFLDQLISKMDAGWSPACKPTPSLNEDIWGVLKTTAVQVMNYLEAENKELPSRLNPRPQYEVQKNDLLITRAGPKNRVGVSCLVNSTRSRLMISDKIIRFHLVEVGIYETFISLCLNAGATAEYLENSKSGMAESQMNISQVKLRHAPTPLCPINEQFRIIKKVNELLTLCDSLKANLNQAQTIQTQLADTLVQQAVH